MKTYYPLANTYPSFGSNTYHTSELYVCSNVVPDASWSHERLQEFVTNYGPYCEDIVRNGIVPASLFNGIDWPEPLSFPNRPLFPKDPAVFDDSDLEVFDASEGPSLILRLWNWVSGANS